MYSLILDTSFKEIGVALYNGSERIDSVSYEAFRKQSEFLLVEIDKILRKNNVNPRNIRRIYVNNGPGSYTGIRMSLAVSKTFSFMFKTDVFLVSSLLAQVGYSRGTTISLIDAKADRAYFGLVKCGKVIEEKVLFLSDVVLYVNAHRNFAVISNFSINGIKSNQPKVGVDGIGEVLKKQKKESDSLRVEPFYFKEAV